MPAEVFVNVGESTLAVAALSTDTTLTLVSGAPFPSAGQYRIRLDDSLQQPGGIATRYEINRATFNAGNVINSFSTGVDLEGTTAQAWPIGTAVRAIVTAAGLASVVTAANAYSRAGAPYKVRVTQGGGQGIPSGTITKVTSMTAAIDPNNNWSAANSNYIVPVAGYYSIWAFVQMSGSPPGAAASFGCDVYVNGAALPGSRSALLTTSSYPTSNISHMFTLAAGDTVDLRIIQNSGGSYSTLSASLALHYLSS